MLNYRGPAFFTIWVLLVLQPSATFFNFSTTVSGARSTLTTTLMLFLTGWLLMELLAPVEATKCYYHNGDVADGDVSCGSGTNYCCPSGDTCVSDGTHGLCMDANNHLNGSLTYFSDQADPGPYNYTGLYKSTSCDNSAFSGCSTYCLSDSSQDEYMWACNDALTSFCCHQDDVSLSQGDCCGNQLYVLSTSVSAIGTSTETETYASTSASTSSTPKSTQVSATTSTGSQKSASASITTMSSVSANPNSSTSVLPLSSANMDDLSSLYPVSTAQASTSTSSASSSASVSGSAVEQSSSSSATPSVSWSDLSGGTKIGIAIASLAVLLLGLGVFLLWRKTRPNRPKSPDAAKAMDVEYSRDAKAFSSLEHPLRCPSCVSDPHHSGRYGSSLSPPNTITPRPLPSREVSPREVSPRGIHHQPFLQELPDTGQVHEMPAGRRTWYQQGPNRL